MFESIASKYIEAVSARLPLRQLLLMILGFSLFAHVIDVDSGVIEGVLDARVNDLVSSGFWVNLDVRLSSIFLSFIFVAFGVVVSKFVARLTFLLVDRFAKYRGRVSASYDNSNIGRLGIDERTKIIAMTAAAEDRAQKILSRHVGLSQASFSVAGYLALEGFFGLDTLVFSVLVFVGCLSVVRSVQFFISDYYPIVTMRERILGLSAVSIDEM